MRVAIVLLGFLIGACHANPEAPPCGQSGDAPCDADAGLLCVQAGSPAGPQTCESTLSCWQPLAAPEAGVSQNGEFLLASTWALAEQQCGSPPPAGPHFYLSATPCDGLVAFMESAIDSQTALYAVDGGALVAIYRTADLSVASWCPTGNVPLSATCLEGFWKDPLLCTGPDASADSSDAN